MNALSTWLIVTQTLLSIALVGIVSAEEQVDDLPPPQILEELQKLVASDADTSDLFGTSVAISGDTLVVGAPGGGSGGSAYVFERNPEGQWSEVTPITASVPDNSDQFGISVDIDQDTIVVGNPGDDDACPGDVGCESGAVYVFERNQGGSNNWGEIKKLTALDREGGDFFGLALSISEDTIAVGARGDDITGSVYIFERDIVGPLWGEARKIVGSDATGQAFFGTSVFLDRDMLIVGASQGGAAYVYERHRGGSENWGEAKKLTTKDAGPSERFGVSVAVHGSTAVVGADQSDEACDSNPSCNSGSAYIFERNFGGDAYWGEVRKLVASDVNINERFGNSVWLGAEAVLIGAFRDHVDGVHAGSAYLFGRHAGGLDNWGEMEKLISSDHVQDDEFGFAVSFDGQTAIIGAHQHPYICCSSGAGYVFQLPAMDQLVFADGFESGDISVWSGSSE